MKKLSLVFALIFFSASLALAQRAISGVVSDEQGEPLIGASVLATGTTVGTTTDIDGKYSINVPTSATSLEISYTGYAMKEVPLGASNIIDVVLAEGVQITDVVVTALGVTREKKTLGYATQKVEGETLTKAKSDNFINSLSGKISGVQIKSNNNFGGSTDIVIRGHASLTGNNQTLFVIDGIPMNNGTTNDGEQTRGQRGYDYGNAASDINPEDIASINILKGAAATALYGSRAANGAVIITTKKGSKNKALGISFSSGISFGNIDKTTFAEYQNEYGAGYGPYYGGSDGRMYDYNGGEAVLVTEDASYGAKFDPNRKVYAWSSFVPEHENFGKTIPWEASKNTPVEFFETAITTNNSVAFSAGNDKGAFRVSYTNYSTTGVMPNSKLDKNTVGLGSSYDFSDKIHVKFGATYVKQKAKGRNSTGYSDNLMTQFRQWWQVNTDILDQKAIFEKTDKNYTWNPGDLGTPETPIYWDNPYWTRYKNYNSDTRDRIFGNVGLTYDFNDWLSFVATAAVDNFAEVREERRAVGSTPATFNVYGFNVDEPSGYILRNRIFSEANYDLMLNFSKRINEGLTLDGSVGYNILRSSTSITAQNTSGGLATPELYSMNNTISPVQPALERLYNKGINGLYARASVGFNNLVYVDVTGRNDVSSTLPDGNNSYFYPSASVSLVFSELVDMPALSFGKVRLAYASVGNDAPVQSLLDPYVRRPIFKNPPLFSVTSTKRNPELKPEKTNSFEAGIEMNFLKNRVGIDFAYYKNNSIDQIMPVALSTATGYSRKYVNSGEIENKGLELTLFGTIVKSKKFTWDMTVNWSKNNNKVISLFEGVKNLQLQSFQGGVTFNATVGEPYGTLRAKARVTDDNGNYIIRSSGYYKVKADQNIGNVQPKWLAGIDNTIKYKDFSLGFLIDMKKGGTVFSLDQYYGMGTGLYPETVGNNAKGNPKRDPVADGGGVLLDGVYENGEKNTTYIRGDRYSGAYYWGRGNDRYAYDASFIKLREASLGYKLPTNLVNKIAAAGATISVYGRNLWIIQKNTPYSDPEEGLGAGNVQGYQAGSYPTVKVYGVKLNLNF